MSTTETHFRDTSYWDDQLGGDFDESAGTEPQNTGIDLPEYSETKLPIFALFLLYIAYWYLQGSHRFPAFDAIRFEFFLAMVVAIFAVIKILTSKDSIGSSLLGWVVAFVALMVVMTFVTVDPVISQTVLIDRVFKLMVMGLSIYAFVCSPMALRWFLATWLFAFAKMAQEGIQGWLSGGLIWSNQGTMRLHGATPMYAHPNSFSGTQLATLPFLYFLFPRSSRILQIVILLQTAAALMIILTTGSRTGYVALAAALLLLIWKAQSKIKAAIVLGLAIFLVAPYIPQDYIDRAETIFTQQDEKGRSIDVRKQIIDDAVIIFEANKLGVGLGAFPSARKKLFLRNQDTHNIYLQILTELGIQGMVLFTALIISCFRQLFKTVELARANLARLEPLVGSNPELDYHCADLKIIVATCFAVTGFLVTRLALGVFGHDLYEVYWWFAIGLTMATARMMATAMRRTDWFIQNLGSGEKTDTKEPVVDSVY